VGDGPVDVVLVPDYMSNLVYGWEWPQWRAFYERLAAFCRLVLFDKRGTGLSDSTGGFPTLETRMEDLHAVLDAVGSRRTVVLGAQEGCAMACLFAATYPERTTALILFQPSASGAADYPMSQAPTAQEWERNLAMLSDLRERWGTNEFSDELLQEIAPSLFVSEENRRWFANWCRVGASPAAAYALNRIYLETDLRAALPAIRVPTLLMYRGEQMEGLTKEVGGLMRAHRLCASRARISGASLRHPRSRMRWSASCPAHETNQNQTACS
jgi:pimeloyl-ACP methyl ester carboxylesterase